MATIASHIVWTRNDTAIYAFEAVVAKSGAEISSVGVLNGELVINFINKNYAGYAYTVERIRDLANLLKLQEATSYCRITDDDPIKNRK